MDRRGFLRLALGGVASLAVAPYVPTKTYSFLGGIYRPRYEMFVCEEWQRRFLDTKGYLPVWTVVRRRYKTYKGQPLALAELTEEPRMMAFGPVADDAERKLQIMNETGEKLGRRYDGFVSSHTEEIPYVQIP